MPEVSQTFCTSLLSLRRYVGERHGKDAFKRVRDTLAAEHAVELPAVIAPGSWLPTQWFVTALHLARDLFGSDDFYVRFGAAAAEYEVKWVQAFGAETRCRDRDGAAARVFEGQW